MMRRVTVGLGVLTILSVIAGITPAGQALLGLRPSKSGPSVTVIPDTPPAGSTTPLRARPAARPAPAEKASPAQGGLEQISRIANILLNLPQVLSQTQVHPAEEPEKEGR